MKQRADDTVIGAPRPSTALSAQRPAGPPSSARAGAAEMVSAAALECASGFPEPSQKHWTAAFCQKSQPRFFAISFIVVTLICSIARAQVYPPAPQGPTAWDSVDGPTAGPRAGFVRVPAGNNGPVDSFGYCRWVTNSNAREDVVPVSTANEWQYYRAGEFNGSPPPGIAEVVCCRPQTVSLCGGAIQETLPYTIYQGTQSYTQNCGTYTETQVWTCGSTLPATPNAVMADGAWQQSSDTDVQTCSANWQSVNQGCTAGCGQTGSYQYYNYDANSCPGDNAYYSYSGSCAGPACCTPVNLGCSGSTAIMSCGGNIAGGCVAVPAVDVISYCIPQTYLCGKIYYTDCGPRTCSNGNEPSQWMPGGAPPGTFCIGPVYCAGFDRANNCINYQCQAEIYIFP